MPGARLAALNPRWLAPLAVALAAAPILFQWWAPGPAPAPLPADVETYRVADTLVVDFKQRASLARVGELAERFGAAFTPLGGPGSTDGLYRVRLDEVGAPVALAQLRRHRLVEAVDFEHRYRSQWTPNDPRYPEQWNFHLVEAERAWETTRGKGVVVAVIDTGVAFEDDDLCRLARDFRETDFAPGWNFIHKHAHPFDDHGHGTHVAGTIAESTDNEEGVAGLAFEATIMPLKVLSREGWGRSGDIAQAIRWAADNGADVINMSLGGPLPDMVMQNAVRYAHKKGVTIVCAAGNSGTGRVGYPAAFKECIAVSAVGPEGELAPYSSWGKQIAVAAPGGDMSRGEASGILQNTIYNGRDGYYFFQGTSMASPHVAAAAALVRARGVKDPEAIRKVLQQSATPREPREKYGAGLLNAAEAVEVAGRTLWRQRTAWALAFLPLLFWVGVSLRRRRPAPHLEAALLLGIGFAAPDLISAWLGEGSRWNLIGHSALIPALLLVGVAPGTLRLALGALAGGFALHLGWDAWQQAAAIPQATGWTVLPWLGVNLALGVYLCATAWRK